MHVDGGHFRTVTATAVATNVVTITNRPTVYSIVGSIVKRTAVPEVLPRAPSVLPRAPNGFRFYNPGASEYVPPTVKHKRQWGNSGWGNSGWGNSDWGNNGWGGQWDRWTPDSAWRPLPSGVPTYASACTAAALYASACYNYGVAGGNNVVGNPGMVVATVTQTVQSTTTVSVPVTSAGELLTPPSLVSYCRLLFSGRLMYVTVCDPANNFGLQYRAGYETNGVNQNNLSVGYPTFPDTTTLQGCCARCFQTAGCMVWFIDAAFANRCSLFVSTEGTAFDANSQCPNGFASTFSFVEDAATATFGIGACTKYIGVPNN